MGGIGKSAVYDDPQLMSLKLDVMVEGNCPHAVRWIEREVHDLRAEPVARSEERATFVRIRIEERRERRRAKQRAREARKAGTVETTTRPSLRPGTSRPLGGTLLH